MYNDCDSQLLSFSLPYARNPHQLPLQLTVGLWLAKDSAFGNFSVFEKIHLCEALQLFLQRGLAGRPLCLVSAPDWIVLRTILNWLGPGDERACPACWARKRLWKRAEYQRASARLCTISAPPAAIFLLLFDSPLDGAYDPLHCIALVITHAVFHGLYLWCQENCSAVPSMQQELLSIFASAKLTKNFREPKGPAISRKEWAIGNKDT